MASVEPGTPSKPASASLSEAMAISSALMSSPKATATTDRSQPESEQSATASGVGTEDGLKVRRLALPAALPLERLTGPASSWDANEWIAQAKSAGIALETLKSDLAGASADVAGELVELINRDYADFINLSSSLSGLSETVDGLREPLVVMRKSVSEVEGAIGEELAGLTTKLNARKLLSRRVEVLELFLALEEALSKLESGFTAWNNRRLGTAATGAGSGSTIAGRTTRSPAGSVAGSPRGGDVEAVLESLAELERCGSELNLLKFYISRGAGFAFVKERQTRVDNMEKALIAALDGILVDALRAQPMEPTLVEAALRGFIAMNSPEAAETAVRTSLVRPKVTATVNGPKLAGARPGSTDGLPIMLSVLGNWVEEKLGPLVAMTTKPNGLSMFDFMTRAAWPEIVDGFVRSASNMFHFAKPDEFFRNYKVSMAFLERMARAAGSSERAVLLRDSSVTNSFLSRWNLQVYFRLRFAEISKYFEDAGGLATFQTASPPVDDLGGGAWKTRGFAAAVAALDKIWAEDVFLAPLAGFCLKLTAQVVSRLVGNVVDCVDRGLSGNLLVALSMDADRAASEIPRQLSALTTASHVVSHDLSAAVKALGPELSSALSTLGPKVRSGFAQGVARSASEAAAVMSSIPRMYNFTGKPSPTEPLPYVGSLLNPLAEFLAGDGAALSPETRGAWVEQVVSSVAAEVSSKLVDVLANVKKLEDSVARFKRPGVGGGAAGGAAGETDYDKMRSQLRLDLSALIKAAVDLGLPSSAPCLADLMLALEKGPDHVASNPPATEQVAASSAPSLGAPEEVGPSFGTE